jgi:hypothetical protein
LTPQGGKGLTASPGWVMIVGRTSKKQKEVILMGMTDAQFKAFLRSEIAHLRLLLEKYPDEEGIKELIERYQQSLED